MHEYMMSLDPEQVHIVYSHGVAISSLVHYILSLHTDTVHRAYTERVRIGNAEIHTFRTGV
jgi:broad specificity phosphatase PhoE